MTEPVWGYSQLLHLIKLESEHSLGVYFQVNDDETDVRVLVDCSDLFYWACADAEPFTPDDFESMEQAIADLAPLDATYWAGDLWCCRRRGMRPQGPWYGYTGEGGKVQRRFVPIAVEALFDAAGPDRTGEPDGTKPKRPADGRRWDYGGADEPPDFVDMFKPGGKFGP